MDIYNVRITMENLLTGEYKDKDKNLLLKYSNLGKKPKKPVKMKNI